MVTPRSRNVKPSPLRRTALALPLTNDADRRSTLSTVATAFRLFAAKARVHACARHLVRRFKPRDKANR